MTSTELFLHIMDDLNVRPVMHEFVAETELSQNQYLEQLLREHRLVVVRYEDYLQNHADQEEYREYFLEAFERLNRYDFPKNEDIYRYKEKQESLGEIRSLYMAEPTAEP